MKLGIIINTKEAETAWNSLRLGNTSLKAGHTVSVFLLGSGVEIENIDHKTYDVKTTLADFLHRGGKLLACGTCLKSRQIKGGACPISTMSELMAMIDDAEKVVTFG